MHNHRADASYLSNIKEFAIEESAVLWRNLNYYISSLVCAAAYLPQNRGSLDTIARDAALCSKRMSKSIVTSEFLTRISGVVLGSLLGAKVLGLSSKIENLLATMSLSLLTLGMISSFCEERKIPDKQMKIFAKTLVTSASIVVLTSLSYALLSKSCLLAKGCFQKMVREMAVHAIKNSWAQQEGHNFLTKNNLEWKESSWLDKVGEIHASYDNTAGQDTVEILWRYADTQKLKEVCASLIKRSIETGTRSYKCGKSMCQVPVYSWFTGCSLPLPHLGPLPAPISFSEELFKWGFQGMEMGIPVIMCSILLLVLNGQGKKQQLLEESRKITDSSSLDSDMRAMVLRQKIEEDDKNSPEAFQSLTTGLVFAYALGPKKNVNIPNGLFSQQSRNGIETIRQKATNKERRLEKVAQLGVEIEKQRRLVQEDLQSVEKGAMEWDTTIVDPTLTRIKGIAMKTLQPLSAPLAAAFLLLGEEGEENLDVF